jgi:hypothetical protein
LPTPIKFHWEAAEPAAAVEDFVEFCREAEIAGLESVGVDSPQLAVAAAGATSALRLRIPYQGPGLPLPDGVPANRFIVHAKQNIVDPAETGHDLDRLRASLHGATIYVEGDTAEAAWLTIRHADCLFLRPGRLDQTYADALPVLHMGKQVGLACRITACPTAEEAEAPDAIAGSSEEIARKLWAYRGKGISHFLVRERSPEDWTSFANGVLPLIREWDRGSAAVA